MVTKKAAKTSTGVSLGKFEGRNVVAAAAAVTNAGDGLSKAMEVDAMLIKQGQTGFLLIEWECTNVSFPPEDSAHPGTGGVRRVHTLRAGTATIVDDEYARQAIESQHEKNVRHAQEAKGQHELGDTELVEAHDKGEHKSGLVDHCPACETERELAAKEAGNGDKPARASRARKGGAKERNGLVAVPGGKTG